MHVATLTAFEDELEKEADVITPLKAHQQRVVDRIQQEDQPGLVVAHGLGSGKTLTSIAAQDALGMHADVVVPAALQANYKKEIKQHTKGKVPKAAIQSMQNVATKKTQLKRPMMVVDEAHRMRDPSSNTFQTLKGTEAKKRLLLTGSPFYNHPSDIAPLIDLAANAKVLPFDKDEFTRAYIAEKTINPSFGQSLANIFRSDENKVRPGFVPILYEKKAPELRAAFKKWVDYHPGSKDAEGFPDVEKRDVPIEMTKEQLRVYDTLMDRAPAWVAAKVKRGLPPSKQEASQLNAFLTASRQATNTTAPFQQDQKNIQDPKIQAAFSSLKKTLEGNPRARAVVYSNFLDAGINPYKAKLDEAKIPYGEFTGAMSKKKREEIVQQYNAGKLRTLLLSSAGGEGLDLKGTRLMQILEPHWNEEKLKQVHGRGARYMSHSDLPPEERKLLIENYIAKRPQGLPTSVYNKITGRAPDKSVDEYLTQMSGDKEKLIEQFRALLPNGKEKKSAAEKKKELFVTDENTQRGKTTEVSRELAKSLKPRAAAFATFTAPLALTGFRLARGLGPNMSTKSQALAGGVGAALGGALGHFIAHNQTANIINDSKAIARQALRTASKENSLREEAGKMNWGDVARSSRNRVISDVATSAPVLTRLATQHIQGKGLKFPTTDLGLMAAGNILGSIGSGYLEKYKKMIAVNELDNVKARMAEQDATRLKRLRNQVAQLETRVEGDGWNAPKKDDAPVEKKKGKLDW